MIHINKLSKKYSNKYALNDLSLGIKSGRVLGLLGPNGSGKTTLIKILVGLVNEYQGDVKIHDMDIGPDTKAIVSYLSDRPVLGHFNRIEDAMDYYEDFFEDFNREKTYKLLESLDLDPQMKVKSLSKGMSEKFHLSLVLGRDAKVYILDEPIAGVDPVARDHILAAIVRSISPESTMIISTHLVRDIEQIFDAVAFIDQGKIIECMETEEIRTQYNMSIEERYKDIFGSRA